MEFRHLVCKQKMMISSFHRRICAAKWGDSATPLYTVLLHFSFTLCQNSFLSFHSLQNDA